MLTKLVPSNVIAISVRLAQFAAAAILALLLCGASRAQVSATVSGVVMDASSTIIAGADITIRNAETGTTRTTTSNEAGRYLVVSLPVGEYEVRASKRGFQEAIRSGIRLVVGQDATIDLTLQISAVKSEVRVEGDSP